jgi:hypothetical protein
MKRSLQFIYFYLFGVIDKIRELKKIYAYADRHFSHVAIVQRLNLNKGHGCYVKEQPCSRYVANTILFNLI